MEIEEILKLTKEDIEKMSFETAFSTLDKIVRYQTSGQIPLEESVKIYEVGILLKNNCEKRLNDAKLRVEKITFSETGEIKKEDFN